MNNHSSTDGFGMGSFMKSLWMNCRRVQGCLEEYSQGELAPGVADAVASHLNRCPKCQEDYETLFTTHCVLSAYPRIQVSPDFDLQVLNQVLLQHAPRPTFFDRLDALFARPAYKLIGSTALGLVLSVIVAGLVVLPYALSSPLLQARSYAFRHLPLHGTWETAPLNAGVPLSAQATGRKAPADEFYASSNAANNVTSQYTYANWLHTLQQTSEGVAAPVSRP